MTKPLARRRQLWPADEKGYRRLAKRILAMEGTKRPKGYWRRDRRDGQPWERVRFNPVEQIPEADPRDRPDVTYEHLFRLGQWKTLDWQRRHNKKHGLPEPPWPLEPIALKGGANAPDFLRSMQFELELALLAYPEGEQKLVPNFRQFCAKHGLYDPEQGLEPIVQYRLLLVSRWLVSQMGSSAFREHWRDTWKGMFTRKVGIGRKSDRLEQTASKLRDLRKIWGLPEEGAVDGLPDDVPMLDLLHPPLARLLRAISGFSLGDLDPKSIREARTLDFEGMKQSTKGLFRPGESKTIEPVAFVGALTLDAVLREALSFKHRRQLITDVLNAVYPCPAGWKSETVGNWLKGRVGSRI